MSLPPKENLAGPESRPKAAGTTEGQKEEFFAKIPQDLIRDPSLRYSARLLFGVYHTYAKKKNLTKGALTYVSQSRVARDLGCSIQSVSNWTKILKEKGWITVRRRGWKSNYVYLHGKPKRREEGQKHA